MCVQEDGGVCSDIDVEADDEAYEEYTWAGQTRIRATSFLRDYTGNA